MPRSRNIKPGFFKNEDLAECTPWARLCFAGLWTLADRDGRLEDRPKRIKAELFPFDTVDVEPLLQELERWKFILRYETDGMKAIQVLEFARHQTPHYSESQSVIKPPLLQESSPDEAAKTPGEEASSCAVNSGNTPGVGPSSRGGRNPLIPDSLIPDSLIPDSLHPLPSVGDTRARTKPQKRAPTDFAVDDRMREWAAEHAPSVLVDTETDKFRDHTFARARSDWVATWRNWMREAEERAQSRVRRVNGHDHALHEPSGRLPIYEAEPPMSEEQKAASDVARRAAMERLREDIRP